MYTNINNLGLVKQAGLWSKAKTGLAIVGGMKLHQMYQDSKVGAKVRHMNELQKQSAVMYKDNTDKPRRPFFVSFRDAVDHHPLLSTAGAYWLGGKTGLGIGLGAYGLGELQDYIHKKAAILAEDTYQDALEKCASIDKLLEKDANKLTDYLTDKAKNKVKDDIELLKAPKEGTGLFSTIKNKNKNISSTNGTGIFTSIKNLGKKTVNGINRLGSSKIVNKMGGLPMWLGSTALAAGAGIYAAHKNSLPTDAYNNAYNN